MSAPKRARIEDLFLKDDPEELVYFRVGDEPLIKIHKSVLIENSFVFKDIFSDKVNNDYVKPIQIHDETYSMDAHKAFVLFARCLYDKESAPSLIKYAKVDTGYDFKKLIFPFEDVLVFANKYHVQWLIEACLKEGIEGFYDAVEKYHLRTSLRHLFYMIKRMGAEDILMPKFKKAKINFKHTAVVDTFKMCQEMGVDELTNQVVDFCSNLDFDPSWPPELSMLVMKRLKKHAARGRLVGNLTAKQIGQLPK